MAATPGCPAQQDGPPKKRGCARVAEGGTGQRPHARPEAALPTAKPTALNAVQKLLTNRDSSDCPVSPDS